MIREGKRQIRVEGPSVEREGEKERERKGPLGYTGQEWVRVAAARGYLASLALNACKLNTEKWDRG